MSDEHAKRLAQLREAYKSGILDEDTYRAAVAALGAQAEVKAEVEGSGAATQVGGVAVGRDVLGSIFHIYLAAPGRRQLTEAEFEKVLNDYLGWVLLEHGRA